MSPKVAVASVVATAALTWSGATIAQEREMSTDRPDKTESAYTVPARAWQLEMDVANYTRNKDADGKTETLSVAPFNLKYGLNDATDIQFVVSPYVQIEQSLLGVKSKASGFGEVTVRLKHNVWGNDGGKTAFAVMPFITFPTADDDIGGGDSVEGGIILPLAVSLSDRLGAGLMAQVNALKDSSDNYSPEFVVSGTLGADITDKFGAYVELYGSKFDDTGEKMQASFDTGITYALSSNLQLDAGTNIGLNDQTDDMQVFLGVSRRW